MAAISSSMKNNEVLPGVHRPTMRVDLFKAAIKGNNKVLIRHLGLPPEAPTEIQVTIETSDPVSQQVVAEYQDAQYEIQSATRFGDTLLHLLITNRHNVLVLKVFAKDMSLLKAHNNKLDTPLHCAAMVGNYEVIGELIRLAPSVVSDVLKETNENGDTALHVAASNNHEGVVRELMKLNTEAAHKENKQGFSPLYIATVEGYTYVVETMLKLDGTLACTQFSDGTFPVHVAARMGYRDLVKHFLEEYPDDAMWLDCCGKNLFHVAAEQDNEELSTKVFTILH
ncbi:Ankyrin repeat protein-like [Rhynchospora pubera]|uniref:Ankyrin repeat protein-like n=1 Tax=Rhynchospora pubera TaxID=906938 RepID=A0AAV8HT92_9POAL|nr:Ankyrin repeat protein-like [Rhynchospora pubera]